MWCHGWGDRCSGNNTTGIAQNNITTGIMTKPIHHAPTHCGSLGLRSVSKFHMHRMVLQCICWTINTSNYKILVALSTCRWGARGNSFGCFSIEIIEYKVLVRIQSHFNTNCIHAWAKDNRIWCTHLGQEVLVYLTDCTPFFGVRQWLSPFVTRIAWITEMWQSHMIWKCLVHQFHPCSITCTIYRWNEELPMCLWQLITVEHEMFACMNHRWKVERLNFHARELPRAILMFSWNFHVANISCSTESDDGSSITYAYCLPFFNCLARVICFTFFKHWVQEYTLNLSVHSWNLSLQNMKHITHAKI